jgi:hypothetical protein
VRSGQQVPSWHLSLTQHGVSPEHSELVVHCTQTLPEQCGVELPHAAQLAPQWASTEHAVHAFEVSQ